MYPLGMTIASQEAEEAMKSTSTAVVVCLMLSAGQAAFAGTSDILIGLDEKITYGPDGLVNGPPGKEAVLVMDVSNPAKPRIRASLPLMNSLLGPPTNLQITPDGRLGLVANSVTNEQDGAAWKTVPDDKLFVIDLAASPPKLIDTLTVGKRPSGLSISRKGDLALVANRVGKSVQPEQSIRLYQQLYRQNPAGLPHRRQPPGSGGDNAVAGPTCRDARAGALSRGQSCLSRAPIATARKAVADHLRHVGSDGPGEAF